ncbi:MAG: hypothetical protein AAF702_43315 [Chloroflexota bacterium]
MPSEVRRIPQWVGYQLIPKPNGKADKVPKNPHTGGNASVTVPQTWADVGTAVAFAQQSRQIDGVAFVLTKLLGMVVVDLDNCVHNGQLSDFANEQVERLNSYTEYSPSGTGLHVYLYARIPGPRRVHRQYQIEMYDDRRFITVTGKRLTQTPVQVMERAEALAQLYNHLFTSSKPAQPPSVEVLPEDAALWDQLFTGREGDKLQALYEGDMRPSRNDHSLAVIQLGNALARATDGDLEQMKRMLYQTKLVRPKWQEARGEGTWIDYQIADCIQYVSKMKYPR